MKLASKRNWLIMAVLVVAAVAGGLHYTGKAKETITPESLREYLGRVMKYEDKYYLTGKRNLALVRAGQIPPLPNQSSKIDFYGSIAPYLSVEFLRTLTPKQIEAIRGSEGRLYYKDLSPGQRQLLTLRDKYRRLASPRLINRGQKIYNTSYGRFEASKGYAPSLQWYFPDVKRGDRVGMWSNSIALNW